MDTITTEELQQLKDSGKPFRLVDVLSIDHFQEEHIQGAVNLPLSDIASEAMDRFDMNDEIIVYCKDKECSASPKAAAKLESIGFQNVKDYEEGLKGWKNAGKPTES
ncbi:rhodanese-like domain-containing protein [Candidatus Nanohalobium constans]|uniref:Rhodanese-related sulfurtransferase n=1 Tax=Candidatus Nanohalobium constans TaxID=2565781 RepID=A0A5Q0UFA8_9ARCH|nr:rhodanese-like domain-containing protein [Candidatus Nanohalobium constans]QGA80041.1 rhodanese-related sulfurtransferase [Candidatus Nanohalobium constans]